MSEFRVADGFLHFVFAVEDDYYLGSLVKLDFHRYLYYCLKKEGYRGIFFLEPRGSQSRIRMDDMASAEIYTREKISGFFAKNPPAERKTEGKRSYFAASFPQEEDLAARFHRLLQSGQGPFAFVMSLQDFDRIYRKTERLKELYGILQRERPRCILVLKASTHAGESLAALTDPESPLCSELCPVLQKAILKGKRFQPYEELVQGMERRVSCWNQMDRESIGRLLMRRSLFSEGEAWPSLGEINDVGDVIYAWFHSEDFAASRPELLSDNEDHRLGLLSEDLGRSQRRQLLSETARELRTQYPGGRLLDQLRQDHVMTDRFLPRLERTPEVKKLSRISVARLMGNCGEAKLRQTVRDYARVLRDLRKPYSDAAGLTGEDWLSDCLQVFEKVENRGFADPDTVEKTVDFLEYCVCRDDRQLYPELFKDKAGYYRQILRTSLEAAQDEAEYRDLAEQERECTARLLKKMEEAKQAERNAPLASDNLAMALAGQESLSGETLLASAAKEAVVNLSRQRENTRRIMAFKRSRIEIFRQAIQQMELSLSQLTGNDMSDLPRYVQNIQDAATRKILLENNLRKELKEAEENFRYTQEELAKDEIDETVSLTEEYNRIKARMEEEPNLC